MVNVNILTLDLCVTVHKESADNFANMLTTVGRNLVAMEHAQIIVEPSYVPVTKDIQDNTVNK